jgi:hypothetical protein
MATQKTIVEALTNTIGFRFSNLKPIVLSVKRAGCNISFN